MTEKQQTAVQWLKAQLAVTHSPEIIEWLWAKAFQMEKEQIIEAYKSGEENAEYYISKCAEQYYNQTYNTNTQ